MDRPPPSIRIVPDPADGMTDVQGGRTSWVCRAMMVEGISIRRGDGPLIFGIDETLERRPRVSRTPRTGRLFDFADQEAAVRQLADFGRLPLPSLRKLLEMRICN